MFRTECLSFQIERVPWYPIKCVPKHIMVKFQIFKGKISPQSYKLRRRKSMPCFQQCWKLNSETMTSKSQRKIVSNLDLDPSKQLVKGENKDISRHSRPPPKNPNNNNNNNKNYLPYTISQKAMGGCAPPAQSSKSRKRKTQDPAKKDPTQKRGKEKSSS